VTAQRRLPSPARRSAGAGWGVHDLRKRPRDEEVGQFPALFQAAIRDITDPETHRVHYFAEDEGQNVYWDEWDESYDHDVFDIGYYDQTNDATEGLVIAGVRLLRRGLYSIYALVDIDATINGMVSVGTNWDEGQGITYYVNNIGTGGQPYFGDHYAFQVHQWRWLERDDLLKAPASFDGDFVYGGEAETVEIILNVHTGIDGFGVTGGKQGGSPGDEVWIPGGYDGAWGFVPRLKVAYWGTGTGTDPAWPFTFGLDAP
jgi:hypothetical protein